MRSNLKTNLFFGAVLLATVASAPVGCNQASNEKRADSTLVSPPLSPAQTITKSSPINTEDGAGRAVRLELRRSSPLRTPATPFAIARRAVTQRVRIARNCVFAQTKLPQRRATRVARTPRPAEVTGWNRAGPALARGWADAFALRNTPATSLHDGGGVMLDMRVLLAGILLAGCAYRPGSYVHERKPFVGERMTVGCLDLAIARRPDMEKHAVMEYAFGNRCDKPEQVDLVYMTVMGRTAGGTERRLIPYDPESQLMVMTIDGHSAGREALAYTSAGDEPIVQICVDVASLVKHTPEQWRCFARLDSSGEPYVGDDHATTAEGASSPTETAEAGTP